jgi:hypothetical protein
MKRNVRVRSLATLSKKWPFSAAFMGHDEKVSRARIVLLDFPMKLCLKTLTWRNVRPGILPEKLDSPWPSPEVPWSFCVEMAWTALG